MSGTKIKDSRLVVVIPLFRVELKAHEIRSIESVREHLLEKYDVVIATKLENRRIVEATDLLEGFRFEFFDDAYSTYQGYNKLLLRLEFYERFCDYDYMLVFQSDCLAFSGDLSYWMEKGLRYVGAPWMFREGQDKDVKFLGVGNGGLSLRDIGKSMSVLKKYDRLSWKLRVAAASLLPSVRVALYKLLIERDWPYYHIGSRNEDIFWSRVASKVDPDFKVADLPDALKFSFEKFPETCYRMN